MIEVEAHPLTEILRPLADGAGAAVAVFVERHPWLADAVPGLESQLISTTVL